MNDWTNMIERHSNNPEFQKPGLAFLGGDWHKICRAEWSEVDVGIFVTLEFGTR